MERVSIRAPKDDVDDLEELVQQSRYPNRSEAIREAIRRLLREEHDRGSQATEPRRRSR